MYIDSNGYERNGDKTFVHRDIMGPILLDALNELFPNIRWIVHHKDGNKLNNNLFNLEVMTQNRHRTLHIESNKASHRNMTIKSRFPGAKRNLKANPERNCWECRIRFNKRQKHIGVFIDPLSASIMYKLIREEIDNIEGYK